jgi:hypothetical protein
MTVKINIENIQAIRMIDPAKGIFLRLKGKGEHQHLVAERKGWFGRFAIKLGLARPYSKNVMKYFERNPIVIDKIDQSILVNLGELHKNFARYRKMNTSEYLARHPIKLQLENPLAPTKNDQMQLALLKTAGEKIAKKERFLTSLPDIQVIACIALKLSSTEEIGSEDIEQYAESFVNQAKSNADADAEEGKKHAEVKNHRDEMIRDMNAKLRNRS